MVEVRQIHGGCLIAARRRFSLAPEPFLDLSTGINPHPYPLPAWREGCFTRLPEPEEEQALLEAAARCYGVAEPAMVVAAPGTQILISLLPRVFPARRVGVLSPTYGEHVAAWGGEAVATVGALEDFEVGVLCNPNNPDGRVFSDSVLLPMATRMAARGGFLLVDEAFADFSPEVSLARYLPHPGLMLLRSFGKSFGLAGVRLGFALTEPARAESLRAALGPWAVSGPALHVGTMALGDSAWLVRAAACCGQGAARLDALLAAAGMEVVGGTSLFRLAGAADARRRADRLGAAGILVRAFDRQSEWLRFGLPKDEAGWQRLEKALHG